MLRYNDNCLITNELKKRDNTLRYLVYKQTGVWHNFESSPITDSVVRCRVYDGDGVNITSASTITINGDAENIKTLPSGTSYTINITPPAGYKPISAITGVCSGAPIYDYKVSASLVTSKARLVLSDSSVVEIPFASTTDHTLSNAEVSAYSATCVECEINEGIDTLDKTFPQFTAMTSVTLPNSLTATTGSLLFSGCKNLKRVNSSVDGVFNLPSGMTSIGSGLYQNCYQAESVIIPSGVTSIQRLILEMSSAGGTSKLKYVFAQPTTAPSIVTDSLANVPTGGTLFYYCGSNYSAWMRTTNYYLGKYSWSSKAVDTTPVMKLTLNSGDEVECYSECGASAITQLDNTSVMYKSATTACEVYAGVVRIKDSGMSGRTNMTSLTLPEGFIAFDKTALQACSALTSVTIPSTLQKVGYGAFSSCSGLTDITLPDGMLWVDDRAFQNCGNLSALTITTVTPPGVRDVSGSSTGSLTGIFNGNTPIQHIYVPWESVAAYKSARGWSQYASIIEPMAYNVSATSNIDFDSQISFTYKSSAYTLTSGDAATHIYNIPSGVDYTLSAQTVLGYIDPSPKTVTGNASADTAVSFSYTEARLSMLRSGGTVINIAKTSSNTAITTAMTSAYTTNAVKDIVKVKVGSGTKQIANEAFNNGIGTFNKLEEVELPDGVTSIGAYAFWGCTGLKNWYLGTGITTVGNAAFAHTYNASRIYTKGGTVPGFASDSNQGWNVFCDDWSTPYGDNTRVGQIRWTGALIAPSGWNTWTTATPTESTPLGYWNWHLAPSVVITQDYRTTGAGHPVWSGCSEWTIPAVTGNVNQTFMRSAHYGYSDPTTALEVEIFANGTYASTPVTGIASSAFTECTNLRSITVYGNPPTLGSNALKGSFPIYVDKDKLDTYKTSWSAYASRIKPIIPLEKKYII